MEATVSFGRAIALIAWTVVVMRPTSTAAQADRPAVPTHDDPVVSAVQNHINALCADHDARLAAVNEPEALARELARARRRFLELLDLDLETPRTPPPVRPSG